MGGEGCGVCCEGVGDAGERWVGRGVECAVRVCSYVTCYNYTV